jgi:hypothetical protein
MKLPLFFAHGSGLLALYLAATVAGYLLSALALGLAWRRKRFIAGVVCVPSLALGALLVSTIHAFWGKLPLALSLAAVACAVLRPPGKKAPQPAGPTHGNGT